MDKNILLQFRNKLFQGGVAYTHVKRSLRELKDHFQDIQQQALLDGYSKDKAKALSFEQIGSLDSLADNIISRPELKSFGYRYPKFSMLFGPLLTYLVTVGILGLLLMAVTIMAEWLLKETDLTLYSYGFNRSVDFVRFSVMYLVPPIFSIIFATYALKNHLAKKYFIWGIAILCAVSCAISFHVAIWPDPASGLQGEIGITIGSYELSESGPKFTYGNNLRLLLVLSISFAYMVLFQKKLEREEV